MPCPRRFAAALQETETTEDGIKMYTWRAVRRQHLQMLRKQTRVIVFFMALIEILRVGAVDMVYRGKHDTLAPGPEDFGISYNVGYFVAWLYMCLFAMLWVPFFSWWVPSLSSSSESDDASAGPSKSDKVLSVLNQINAVLLPATITLALLQHIYHTISTFIHVLPRPADPSIKSPHSLNTRKAWGVRALLFAGICFTTATGKAAFMILENMDLAHVKQLEYLVICIPIQINLGILLGSAIQFKTEQRATRKAAEWKRVDAEAAEVSEKEALIERA